MVFRFLSLVNVDPRVSWGCPIIGCPSYIDLMEYRLQMSGLPNAPPHLPQSFRQLLERTDPGSYFRRTGEIPASLTRKHILVISGETDRLVPWSASEPFITRFNQESDRLQVEIFSGIGHEYNPSMRDLFCAWMHQFI